MKSNVIEHMVQDLLKDRVINTTQVQNEFKWSYERILNMFKISK